MENSGAEVVVVNPAEPGLGERNKLPSGMATSRNKKEGVNTSRMTSTQFLHIYIF
jgi:hypothetical protein